MSLDVLRYEVRRRPWETACLVGILAVAGWLRFRELGLTKFKSDEALAVRMARDILDGHIRTVGLTSSVGASNPPLFPYLTAIPLAVRDDPLAATAFVGVLAVAAVALTYFVLRPRFGAFTALAAAALFATGPWAVLYGRQLWAQNMLPIVAVSLLWSLFCVLERPRTRAVWLVPVFLSLTVQLNFSALALAVPVAVVLAYRARQVHWGAFAAGVGVAIVLLAPWLAHEAKHGFSDVVTLATDGRGHGGGSTPGAGTVEAIRQTARLAGDTGWSLVVGRSRELFVDDAGWAWTFGRGAGVLAAALLLLGLVTCSVHVVRGARRRRTWPPVELDLEAERRALLLVWVVGIWLSYFLSAPDNVHPHYLIVTYPVTFALVGVGLSDVLGLATGRTRRVAAAAAAGLVAAIAAAFIAFTIAFGSFVDKHGGTAGDYGVVYREQAALARALRERRLDADDPVIEFLATGSFDPQPGAGAIVAVRNHLEVQTPLPCDGELRSFGPLDACFPPTR